MDNAIRFWDIEMGVLVNTIDLGKPVTIGLHEAVNWIGWNANDSLFAATNWDYRLRIWQSTHEQFTHKLPGHKGALITGAWSPDGLKIATASMDHTVRIWDARVGATLLVLGGHTDSVFSVCWSSDGSRLASAGEDGTIRIWNPGTGQLSKVIQASGISAMDWASDGRLAYSTSLRHQRYHSPITEPPIIVLSPEETLI
jgi:WD40 repeat protein